MVETTIKDHIETLVLSPIGYILGMIYLLIEKVAEFLLLINYCIEILVMCIIYKRNHKLWNVISGILQYLIIGGILKWIL